MAFRVSPGVSIKEIDLTTVVPAVATTPGGFAGYFHWGPTDQIVTVTQQTELASIFGKPYNDNYVDFFTAGNFLNYGNRCQVVRVVGATANNASVTVAGVCYASAYGAFIIKNDQDFNAPSATVTTASSQATTSSVLFAAKYPGALGSSLKVVVTNGAGITGGTLCAAAAQGATFITISTGNSGDKKYFSVGDEITFSDGTSVAVSGIRRITSGLTSAVSYSTGLSATYKDFFGVTSGYNSTTATITATLGFSADHIYVDITGLLPVAQVSGATLTIKSAYAKMVGSNAGTTPYAADAGGTGDLVNVLVLDKDGTWTGTQNTLIEKFEGLSRASDARKYDGSSNYYKTVINDQSDYVWSLSADLGSTASTLVATKTDWTAIGPALNASSAVGAGVSSLQLTGGNDVIPTDSLRWANGWSKFADADAVDVSLLPLGNASATLAQLVVQNVCEKRLDCMAFVSPATTDVVNALPYQALSNIKTFRDTTFNINSSYAVIDSGWKYQLDTYNNLLRTMPLNADIAGLVARTEFTNEAWFSPAGYNRGQIKNVVKLAYNPSQEAHRDELYTRQINPVVSFPGQGVILFGDKTAQTRPSAFDRINVRRLFIILEKAIATASKFFLFEQNDAFTRAQFKNLVVPFLKTVQQRRGITDFSVVCDETNNTGEVIDRNEFVADIFVKPTRSVNFISLNFIATKTGVSFTEVGA
jgi:phage tail sheath protein FI